MIDSTNTLNTIIITYVQKIYPNGFFSVFLRFSLQEVGEPVAATCRKAEKV